MTEASDRLRPVEVRNSRGAEQFTRILEALARVELTDGLTFSQLVIEVSGHLPRDATVAAVLSDVPAEVMKFIVSAGITGWGEGEIKTV